MKTTKSKTSLTGAIMAALVASLSGCVSQSVRPESENVVSQRPAAVSVDASADWAWVVSGDNAIRPLQVFSLNGKTYLQMRPGQVIPAVVVNSQPVPFSIAAPYIVVQGEPSRLDLLASGFRAVVMHRGAVAMPEPAAPIDRVERISANGALPPAPPTTYPAGTNSQYAYAGRPDAVRFIQHEPVSVPTPMQSAVVDARVAKERVWRIEPDQRLLSKALADWSRTAGMHLVWKSQVDVPITGAAEYHDGSFLLAMSRVLADASGSGYRFFFSMTGDNTVTVVALRAS